jgi:hypothetical protein
VGDGNEEIVVVVVVVVVVISLQIEFSRSWKLRTLF